MHLLADLEPETAFIRSQPPDLRQRLATPGDRYFQQPIPRKVHNIWFGDAKEMRADKVNLWRQFSQKFNYEHHLWTEADDESLKDIMSQNSFALLQSFRRDKSFRAASDLVRLHLLNHFGGVYVDVDIGPPLTEAGELIDLASIVSLSNCVFMTENLGRNVGNGGIFVMNGFMASAPAHPLIAHLVDTVAQNIVGYKQARPEVVGRPPYFGAQYMTGPFFINMALAGVVQVLPIQTGYA